jgi:radical SAM protein with 4Fe4S-binding SPASM domain
MPKGRLPKRIPTLARMRKHRLHLNITERCNLRWLHCYWGEFGVHSDPSPKTIEEILVQFKRLTQAHHERGKHMLTLGGGEPTLRPDLEDLIALSVRLGFRTRLVTNAVSLDAARASSLKKAGLEVAQVSIDGACQQTHESVRGNGTWQRTMAGIAALKYAKVPTVLSCVLLPGINMEEAPHMLDLVQRLKLAGVKFARPIREGQALINGVDTEGDFWATYQLILDHAESIRYRRFLFFFDPLAHRLRVPENGKSSRLWGLVTDLCQCNNTELVEVNAPSGDVYYCRIRRKLGNLWQQDLVDLWLHHPLLVSLRRKTPEGVCKGCAAWKGCRGGCPAVVTAKGEEPLLQDTDCVDVRKQGGPLLFSAAGYSNARVFSAKEEVQSLGRRLRDALYSTVLR